MHAWAHLSSSCALSSLLSPAFALAICFRLLLLAAASALGSRPWPADDDAEAADAALVPTRAGVENKLF